MKLITDDLIKELYTKYDGSQEEGGRCTWEVTADIINELLPREQHNDNEAGYYFHVHLIWESVERYVKSTYPDNHPVFGVTE